MAVKRRTVVRVLTSSIHDDRFFHDNRTANGEDEDKYPAGTGQRTAVAAKRDRDDRRTRPRSRAPNDEVVSLD
jgi:hypothetical protein